VINFFKGETQNCRYSDDIAGGPGSSVGIATDYGLDGPGSNPGGEEIFPTVQTGPGAHPAACKMGTESFPGRRADPHHHLVPRS